MWLEVANSGYYREGEHMFSGGYHHTMDEKGRIRIPKDIRESLGETFYITKGFDRSLFVFTEEKWQDFQEKLSSNQLNSKNIRKIHRFFTGSATKCSLDGQGRVSISQQQREYGYFEKDVIIMGVSNRLEIWAKEVWDAYSENDLEDISDIADEAEELIL